RSSAMILAATLCAASALAQAVPPTAASPSPSPSPSVSPTASPKPAPPPGPPIVVWLLNGDRLTGTVASETKTAVRVKLPFGSLLVPKSAVQRLVRADGKEEVLN